MAMVRTVVSVSLLAVCAWIADAGAGGGLRGAPSPGDLDLQLAFETDAKNIPASMMNEFVIALLPSFTAMPKNKDGNLPHQTARYLIHRLFVARHGWHIKGLEPNGDVFHTNTSEDSFRDWVPSYLVDYMEKRVGHHGLNLNDVAVLAAALEHLIQQEAMDFIGRIYKMMARKGGAVEPRNRVAKVKEMVRIYMASFLSGAIWDAPEAYNESEQFFAEYNDTERTEQWFQAIVERHLNETTTMTGYEVAVRVAMDVEAGYGAFNDQQCTDLKAALLGVWGKARTTGRVRLSDFYKLGLESQWNFNEKKDYLKALGALDEANLSSPMVIIPNYLSSKSNCLDATNLFAACCRNECEDILGRLERRISGPSATPDQIIELVSNLGSGTVPAPRELDDKLVERLDQIAEVHDHEGKVRLHGRLFSQWLHHAYPNECPYPHEAGIADPYSPDEWMGVDVIASAEERQQIIEAEQCGLEQACGEWAVELPWSHTEELLPDHAVKPSASSTGSGGEESVGLVCKLVLLVVLGAWCSMWLLLCTQAERLQSCVFGAAAAVHPKAIAEKLSPRHLALAVLAVVLVLTNMVNGTLLALMACVGVLLQRILASSAQRPNKLADKLVDCMV